MSSASCWARRLLLLGRRAGRLVTAGVNIAVAFPGLLLALFFAVDLRGRGHRGGAGHRARGAPAFARLTQTLAAGVGEAGLRRGRADRRGRAGSVCCVRHVLPNIGEPLVVNATIGAGGALLAFAGLSFLGLGVQAPRYDWGRLLQDGLDRHLRPPRRAPWRPASPIVVAGLAFNLFGEAVAKGGRPAGRSALAAPVAGCSRRRGRARPPSPVRAGRATSCSTCEDLSVTFPGAGGPVTPVRGVSFTVRRGEAVGVVGESGSGKSLTALAVARLIEEPGRGRPRDRLELPRRRPARAARPRAPRACSVRRFALVFQDPMTSFNPTRRIGRQLAEVARQHQGLSRAAGARPGRRPAARGAGARARAACPPVPARVLRRDAAAGDDRDGADGRPRLIIADEPTTALDVTVQRQVLRLLRSRPRARTASRCC